MRSVQVLVGDPFLVATLDLPFRRAVGSDRVLRCWDGLVIIEFASSTGRYRYEPTAGDLRLVVLHEALPVLGPEEVARRIRSNAKLQGVEIVIVGTEHTLEESPDFQRLDHLNEDRVAELLLQAGVDDPSVDGQREASRRGGLKGGKVRAERLSAERRSEIARQAARARWDRKK